MRPVSTVHTWHVCGTCPQPCCAGAAAAGPCLSCGCLCMSLIRPQALTAHKSLKLHGLLRRDGETEAHRVTRKHPEGFPARSSLSLPSPPHASPLGPGRTAQVLPVPCQVSEVGQELPPMKSCANRLYRLRPRLGLGMIVGVGRPPLSLWFSVQHAFPPFPGQCLPDWSVSHRDPRPPPQAGICLADPCSLSVVPELERKRGLEHGPEPQRGLRPPHLPSLT